eukprot:gene12913-biopygen4978
MFGRYPAQKWCFWRACDHRVTPVDPPWILLWGCQGPQYSARSCSCRGLRGTSGTRDWPGGRWEDLTRSPKDTAFVRVGMREIGPPDFGQAVVALNSTERGAHARGSSNRIPLLSKGGWHVRRQARAHAHTRVHIPDFVAKPRVYLTVWIRVRGR